LLDVDAAGSVRVLMLASSRIRQDARMKKSSLVVVALGVILFAISVPFVALQDGGWPWHSSISETAGRQTATVVDEDGTNYQFTGTPAEAQSWLDRTEQHLRDTHGITTRITVGKVLRVAGPVLIVGGLVLLVSRRRGFRVAGPDPARSIG